MSTDTGMIAEVPKEDRLDVDEGEYSLALEGGDDTENLQELYDNPGEVVDLGYGEDDE